MTTQTNRQENKRTSKFLLIDLGWEILCFFKDNTSNIEPNTRDKLATFEPTTLPITIAPWSSKETKNVVSISGADVPKAITVEPIRNGYIPNCLAAKKEYFSNLSALIHIRAMPDI